jgi:hypothetical protein
MDGFEPTIGPPFHAPADLSNIERIALPGAERFSPLIAPIHRPRDLLRHTVTDFSLKANHEHKIRRREVALPAALYC